MQLRDTHVQRLKTEHFDVVIVGGGINGAASAAALAGKGVKVALIDRGDFSGETSQHSSNLVWGGIKYMESYDFALVRKLCKSRNHLIRSFPSTVQEIRFLTTVDKGFRHHPRTLWLGTWLYWLMGNAFTRLPRYLNPKGIKAREPIVDTGNAVGGFEYSDAYLHDNDARFVFNFVRTALDYGAAAANYVESRGASRQGGHWVVDGWDHQAQTSLRINASVLINASGPWVDDHNQRSGQVTEHHHAYSKGIHLIVPRLTDHHRVLAFFADDGRLFFAIPMGPRTCIGTTDTREQRPEVAVTDQDVSFVLDNINKRLTLERPLTSSDVIASRCGVRPLAVKASADGQRDFLQMSRKHAIDTSSEDRHISIFGGKLTDCVNVGEEIVAEVAALGVTIPDPDARWYGEPHADDRREFMHQARLLELDTMTPASSSEALSTRLWRRYGLSAFGMLDQIRRDRRQGELLIAGTEYLRCELEHAASKEMITRMDDFLRRRSKIALVVDHESLRDAPGLEEAARILFGDDAEQQLQEYFHTHRPAPLKLA
ncbi:FAD-dependent oxidoreductase [Halomonas denitrificans]|uniref:glycerol-3-phosphate dehydrogenase/oxidase n=1 Tax=Halomonas TaxID=2745 RepID=UPI001C9708F3|nr:MULTISPECIES: FAD-dependent oxidoreductase [Halomonas]MBY6029927.1 FAD-dependent oxidoreductase [Halomonas sp. DP8Y7-1]MCA0973351.1 FAD-dependent oxidoreductase [Halomonas denitrificans]